jgi:hypothetical protein
MTGDERLERYRLNAEKCLALAQTFNDLRSKRTLIGMANTWLKLVEQAATRASCSIQRSKEGTAARF